jgi:hypothetical protein
MGQFGRITALADLPSPADFKTLVAQVALQNTVAAAMTPKKRPAAAGR